LGGGGRRGGVNLGLGAFQFGLVERFLGRIRAGLVAVAYKSKPAETTSRHYS